MILQCPKCNYIKDWDQEKPPGECSCGAYAPWKVLKEFPKITNLVL